MSPITPLTSFRLYSNTAPDVTHNRSPKSIETTPGSRKLDALDGIYHVGRDRVMTKVIQRMNCQTKSPPPRWNTSEGCETMPGNGTGLSVGVGA